MEKKNVFKLIDIEIKSTDEDKREITAVGSREKVDRDGDVIKVDGISLTNYRKNPAFLWSHMHSQPPIGKATKVWKEDKRLKFKVKYADADDYPFADTIYRLTKAGYIKAFSIGFKPDWQAATFNEKNGGYDFPKSELLELSAVNVPANADALIQSKQAFEDKVINQEELDDIIYYMREIDDNGEMEKELMKEAGIERVEEPEKDTGKQDDLEQTVNEKCACCGEELLCLACNDIQKDIDNDLFDWLFQELETKESNTSPQEELVDELLNSLNED